MALNQDAGYFRVFDWKDWLIMICLSVFHVGNQIYNFKATQTMPLPVRLPMNVSNVIF